MVLNKKSKMSEAPKRPVAFSIDNILGSTTKENKPSKNDEGRFYVMKSN